MSRDQRSRDNWALLHACEVAKQQGTGVAVAFNLVSRILCGKQPGRSFDSSLILFVYCTGPCVPRCRGTPVWLHVARAAEAGASTQETGHFVLPAQGAFLLSRGMLSSVASQNVFSNAVRRVSPRTLSPSWSRTARPACSLQSSLPCALGASGAMRCLLSV